MAGETGPSSPQGKVGEPLVRPYEVMVIFDASLEDDAVRSQVERYTGQLSAAGAKSVKADTWGKRRLAYPVRHRNEGYYVVIEANTEPPAVADLDRALKLADEVLRHKVIRLPDRVAGRSRPAAPVENITEASTDTKGA